MLQILMPMAGGGGPFAKAGTKFPKPLVEVKGRPMVEFAVTSVKPAKSHRFLFVIAAADNAKYRLDMVLEALAPGCRIVKAQQPTAGALCTALLAADDIDLEKPLIVCNGDQFLDAVIDQSLADFEARDLDVGIITFESLHPRWSYAAVDETGMVVETAEKAPISRHATVGLYYFRTGGMFLRAAERALSKERRHDNQFYICPSINELVLEGLRIGIHPIANERFIPLGTPDDLDAAQGNPRLVVPS